jgi:hypothetical protein
MNSLGDGVPYGSGAAGLGSPNSSRGSMLGRCADRHALVGYSGAGVVPQELTRSTRHGRSNVVCVAAAWLLHGRMLRLRFAQRV